MAYLNGLLSSGNKYLALAYNDRPIIDNVKNVQMLTLSEWRTNVCSDHFVPANRSWQSCRGTLSHLLPPARVGSGMGAKWITVIVLNILEIANGKHLEADDVKRSPKNLLEGFSIPRWHHGLYMWCEPYLDIPEHFDAALHATIAVLCGSNRSSDSAIVISGRHVVLVRMNSPEDIVRTDIVTLLTLPQRWKRIARLK